MSYPHITDNIYNGLSTHVNKGTGAGGANTNYYGKQFEEYYGIPQAVADNDVAEMRFETIDKHLKKHIKKK